MKWESIYLDNEVGIDYLDNEVGIDYLDIEVGIDYLITILRGDCRVREGWSRSWTLFFPAIERVTLLFIEENGTYVV